MRKRELFLLLVIVIAAFIVRLYRFDNPIADWHSWRQADTSAVSRNFVKYGFDILHPRYDDLTKTLANIDNPQGYRFVEFPLYNAAQAGLFLAFDRITLEQWGRIVSIVSQLVTMVFLYLLVKKYRGTLCALLAGIFFAFVPYNIYYGRTILPDPSMLMAIVGATYFFDKWVSDNIPSVSHLSFWFALLFTASSFLFKPYAVFFALPMVWLAFEKWRTRMFVKWELWVFALLAILPLAFWRVWMIQYPEGIPASWWLLNGNDIRFKGAFFQWIFADRIGRLILGYWGLPFVLIGIIAKVNQKAQSFFLSFLLSSLLYLTIVASGNVTHDYYQILIVPTLAIFWANGVTFVLEKSPSIFNRKIAYVIVAVSALFMLGFGWYHVRDFFNINRSEIVEAGRVVDQRTPKDAKVIAVYNGDTAFLYQTNRQGWAMHDRELRDLIRAGASHLVYVNPTEADLGFSDDFATVAKTDRYVIYDMTKPPRIGSK